MQVNRNGGGKRANRSDDNKANEKGTKNELDKMKKKNQKLQDMLDKQASDIMDAEFNRASKALNKEAKANIISEGFALISKIMAKFHQARMSIINNI